MVSFKAAQVSGRNDSSQRIRVTLRTAAAVQSVKTFVWCGNQICEERNGSGATVTKRFFAEGEQRIEGGDAVNYYYTRDHLGSVREVSKSNDVLVARYDYDPYGNRVVLYGDMDTDFGYTGHYYHAQSGLDLTMYRAYDPKLGRWLSRDPMEEAVGTNLYTYVANDPNNLIDPLGLAAVTLYLPYRSSISFHVPFTRHIPGEMAHERQHALDYWNGVSLPPWQLEQRAYRAQAAYVREKILRLLEGDCPDLEYLDFLQNEALTFDVVADHEWAAKDYLKAAHKKFPLFWQ